MSKLVKICQNFKILRIWNETLQSSRQSIPISKVDRIYQFIESVSTWIEILVLPQFSFQRCGQRTSQVEFAMYKSNYSIELIVKIVFDSKAFNPKRCLFDPSFNQPTIYTSKSTPSYRQIWLSVNLVNSTLSNTCSTIKPKTISNFVFFSNSIPIRMEGTLVEFDVKLKAFIIEIDFTIQMNSTPDQSNTPWNRLLPTRTIQFPVENWLWLQERSIDV